MDQLIIILAVGIVGIFLGSVLGYIARATLLRKRAGTIEKKLRKQIEDTKNETEQLVINAQEKADKIIESARHDESIRREEILKAEKFLAQRERMLQGKMSDADKKEIDLQKKEETLENLSRKLEEAITKETEKLEKIASLSAEEAKGILVKKIEMESKQELLERMQKLEDTGKEGLKERAQRILSTAIQKYALSQAQETTITTVALPSDKVKGRIIGKEGRNIKTFEKITGVEVIIDETPEMVIISSFSPIRRHIAKLALEKLIEDGRIQPSRIEEIVKAAEEATAEEIKKAGDTAVYDTNIIDLPSKLVELIGRLKFRTSFGQNVLLHSIEVAHLSGVIASEIGANVKIAKKAGLLHDIGKALDQQVEGSHVDIGIKVLEKFNIEPEIISAMKSHHEEYPYETIESQIIQAADQISGARPGARKDTLENYLKRLGDLEKVATDFEGVEKAFAIQAGREIRVFVKSDSVDDYGAKKLAQEIAKRVQEELNYPGEIKVVVIREKRIIEYAK
jgi:ribonuclease Y